MFTMEVKKVASVLLNDSSVECVVSVQVMSRNRTGNIMNVLGHAGFSSYIGWTNRSFYWLSHCWKYLGKPEAIGREFLAN